MTYRRDDWEFIVYDDPEPRPRRDWEFILAWAAFLLVTVTFAAFVLGVIVVFLLSVFG